MEIHECTVHAKGGSLWVSPPRKPRVDRQTGSVTAYDPIISFSDKNARDRWSAAIIQALADAHPGFDGEGEQ
jgi:hypothetical protein